MKAKNKYSGLNRFRFWSRNDWVLWKTVFLIGAYACLAFLPLWVLFDIQPAETLEAFRNQRWVDAYAIAAVVLAVPFFWWLWGKKLPE